MAQSDSHYGFPDDAGGDDDQPLISVRKRPNKIKRGHTTLAQHHVVEFC